MTTLCTTRPGERASEKQAGEAVNQLDRPVRGDQQQGSLSQNLFLTCRAPMYPLLVRYAG